MSRRRFLRQGLSGLVAGCFTPRRGTLAENSVLRRRLRFSLTFSNPMEHALERQSFWCYLPASIAPNQRLVDLKVSMEYRLHEDILGHNILELSFPHVPSLAQKAVSVTAELELSSSKHLDILPNPAVWLTSERFIEVDDPRIRELALTLCRQNAMDTARAIYDWVSGNLVYTSYLADDIGAVQVLVTRHGDCTEYADLVVALARCCGICARMVGGYVVDRDMVVRPQDYHNWAELYLEGSWQLVDAQKENWLEVVNQHYVAVRIYRDEPTNSVGVAHRYRVDGELQVFL